MATFGLLFSIICYFVLTIKDIYAIMVLG